MNIVFYLSEPVDFTPIYSIPVPVELIEMGENSHFDELFSMFHDAFPDANFYAIDSCIQPVFHKFIEDIDVLNFPGTNLFAKMYLFASFAVAVDLETSTLFIPANIDISPFSSYAEQINNLLKEGFLSTTFIYFGSKRSSNPYDYIKTGSTMLAGSRISLKNLDVVSQPSVYNGDEKEEKEKLVPGERLFSFNSLKFMDSLATNDRELNEMFFLIVDAWKDGSINTVLSDIIDNLKGYSFARYIMKLDEKMAFQMNASTSRLIGLSGIHSKLSKDENNNYVEGNFELDKVHNSILINESENTVSVSNQNNISIRIKNGDIHVSSIF